MLYNRRNMKGMSQKHVSKARIKYQNILHNPFLPGLHCFYLHKNISRNRLVPAKILIIYKEKRSPQTLGESGNQIIKE